jgi:branched-chain amino acid transport system permease protein
MDINTIIILATYGILLAGIYTAIAVGLSLIFGVMEVINFAHGTFVMLGGYMAFVAATDMGLNPLVAIFPIIPLMFLLGYVIETSLIENVVGGNEMNSLILTFGLSLALEGILTQSFGTVAQTIPYLNSSIKFFDAALSLNKIVTGAIGWFFVLLLAVFLSRAKFGQAIRATAQSPDLAEACGINAPKIRSITFGVGLALAGVAGALYMLSYDVSPVGGRFLTLLAFVIVVLGGVDSPTGAAVGALFIALFQSFGNYIIGTQGTFFFVFMGIAVILLLKPRGLFGSVEVKNA